MKKTGFPPIVDKMTKILVLGTMPGNKSIETGEYYANTTNQFWKIIFNTFNSGKMVLGYKEKTDLLLKNRIGLWDVLSKAHRESSLDSDLKNEELNDFTQLFKDYPNIKFVIFNGQKPVKYFKNIGNIPKDKEYHVLPSTSSANTNKTFESKLKEWQEILIK